MSEQRRTEANPYSYWIRPYVTDGMTVHVHVTPGEAGRRVINRLVIEAPDITAETMRSVPIGILAARVQYGEPHQALRPYGRLTKAIDDLAAVAGAAPPVTPKRPRLTRPDGTDPEGFSRLVAQAYREAAVRTSYPAVELAEEAGVPVTTVHRWVRDARRLGLLPPARQGRAG